EIVAHSLATESRSAFASNMSPPSRVGSTSRSPTRRPLTVMFAPPACTKLRLHRIWRRPRPLPAPSPALGCHGERCAWATPGLDCHPERIRSGGRVEGQGLCFFIVFWRRDAASRRLYCAFL